MFVAILGGSFDPIHKGHLQIAKQALKQLPIDEVWFMPSMDTPLKEDQCASFKQRVQMVKLAIQPYRHMNVCLLEGERSGISYTIDTVKELLRRYKNNTFCWLIGDDQAKQFDAWKDSEQLKQLIPFFVFSREENAVLGEGLHRITMPLIQVSSTQIRNGEQLRFVDQCVMQYIGNNGLYLESMMQSCMSEKRFLHSKSVATLCATLAKAHHLDEQIAYRMGIVHDVCKELPYEKSSIWMKYHMPEALQEAPAIWHGYIGAYVCKHMYAIYNKAILHAVYHHVKGNCNHPYAQILYIADKLDPLRGYDSSKQIALSKKSLALGYACVKKEQDAFLKKEGVRK